MFCKHNFKLIQKTVAQPHPNLRKLEGGSRESLFLAMGVTTYIFQCTKCNKIVVKECIGADVSLNKDLATP